MKSYPLYQDTGVKWLGRIPISWRVKRIKHNTYVKGRVGWQGLNSNEFGSLGPYLVTGTDFKNGRIDWDTCYHVSTERYDEDPFIQLQNQDLLITKDGTIGKVAIVENLIGQATLNSGVFVTRPDNNDYITPYLYWLLNSNVFSLYIDYTKTGSTVQHLYQATFVEFSFPVPSITEQQAIADFLDRKTAQIDTFIAKKQRQIELLQEQRTAVINRAVTKGLDPSVPMKDSVVDWIGYIPEYWHMIQIKYVTPRINSQSDQSLDTDFRIALENIESNTGRLLGNSSFDGAGNSFQKGDILFCKLRPYLCKVTIAPQAGVAVSDLLVMTPTNIIDVRYMLYRLLDKDLISVVDSSTYGAKMPRASWEFIGNLKIPIPPLSEQRTIVHYLDNQTAIIDNLILKTNQLIELLEEYRNSLISEVVTGKIDVRGEA